MTSDFTVIKLRERKKQNLALLIPCLNEGGRLIRQIDALEEELDVGFDLILIDGGSKDGSIETIIKKSPKILQSVIISHKKHGLSFDLHLGLGAVSQDYRYVMTLDGNGKDDVRNLRKMFEYSQLHDFDFVQGSRFIHGGSSINLPRDRYFGIKLFLSPIITLFSRKYYTDPSNQCRVFSQRAIEMVTQIDISKFLRYDYFFYIPIRLSRSNFAVSEFPVTRVYPADGSVPTHIKKSHYFRLGVDLLKVSTTWKKYN